MTHSAKISSPKNKLLFSTFLSALCGPVGAAEAVMTLTVVDPQPLAVDEIQQEPTEAVQESAAFLVNVAEVVKTECKTVFTPQGEVLAHLKAQRDAGLVMEALGPVVLIGLADIKQLDMESRHAVLLGDAFAPERASRIAAPKIGINTAVKSTFEAPIDFQTEQLIVNPEGLLDITLEATESTLPALYNEGHVVWRTWGSRRRNVAAPAFVNKGHWTILGTEGELALQVQDYLEVGGAVYSEQPLTLGDTRGPLWTIKGIVKAPTLRLYNLAQNAGVVMAHDEGGALEVNTRLPETETKAAEENGGMLYMRHLGLFAAAGPFVHKTEAPEGHLHVVQFEGAVEAGAWDMQLHGGAARYVLTGAPGVPVSSRDETLTYINELQKWPRELSLNIPVMLEHIPQGLVRVKKRFEFENQGRRPLHLVNNGRIIWEGGATLSHHTLLNQGAITLYQNATLDVREWVNKGTLHQIDADSTFTLRGNVVNDGVWRGEGTLRVPADGFTPIYGTGRVQLAAVAAPINKEGAAAQGMWFVDYRGDVYIGEDMVSSRRSSLMFRNPMGAVRLGKGVLRAEIRRNVNLGSLMGQDGVTVVVKKGLSDRPFTLLKPLLSLAGAVDVTCHDRPLVITKGSGIFGKRHVRLKGFGIQIDEEARVQAAGKMELDAQQNGVMGVRNKGTLEAGDLLQIVSQRSNASSGVFKGPRLIFKTAGDFQLRHYPSLEAEQLSVFSGGKQVIDKKLHLPGSVRFKGRDGVEHKAPIYAGSVELGSHSYVHSRRSILSPTGHAKVSSPKTGLYGRHYWADVAAFSGDSMAGLGGGTHIETRTATLLESKGGVHNEALHTTPRWSTRASSLTIDGGGSQGTVDILTFEGQDLTVNKDQFVTHTFMSTATGHTQLNADVKSSGDISIESRTLTAVRGTSLSVKESLAVKAAESLKLLHNRFSAKQIYIEGGLDNPHAEGNMDGLVLEGEVAHLRTGNMVVKGTQLNLENMVNWETQDIEAVATLIETKRLQLTTSGVAKLTDFLTQCTEEQLLEFKQLEGRDITFKGGRVRLTTQEDMDVEALLETTEDTQVVVRNGSMRGKMTVQAKKMHMHIAHDSHADITMNGIRRMINANARAVNAEINVNLNEVRDAEAARLAFYEMTDAVINAGGRMAGSLTGEAKHVGVISQTMDVRADLKGEEMNFQADTMAVDGKFEGDHVTLSGDTIRSKVESKGLKSLVQEGKYVDTTLMGPTDIVSVEANETSEVNFRNDGNKPFKAREVSVVGDKTTVRGHADATTSIFKAKSHLVANITISGENALLESGGSIASSDVTLNKLQNFVAKSKGTMAITGRGETKTALFEADDDGDIKAFFQEVDMLHATGAKNMKVDFDMKGTNVSVEAKGNLHTAGKAVILDTMSTKAGQTLSNGVRTAAKHTFLEGKAIKRLDDGHIASRESTTIKGEDVGNVDEWLKRDHVADTGTLHVETKQDHRLDGTYDHQFSLRGKTIDLSETFAPQKKVGIDADEKMTIEGALKSADDMALRAGTFDFHNTEKEGDYFTSGGRLDLSQRKGDFVMPPISITAAGDANVQAEEGNLTFSSRWTGSGHRVAEVTSTGGKFSVKAAGLLELECTKFHGDKGGDVFGKRGIVAKTLSTKHSESRSSSFLFFFSSSSYREWYTFDRPTFTSRDGDINFKSEEGAIDVEGIDTKTLENGNINMDALDDIIFRAKTETSRSSSSGHVLVFGYSSSSSATEYSTSCAIAEDKLKLRTTKGKIRGTAPDLIGKKGTTLDAPLGVKIQPLDIDTKSEKEKTGLIVPDFSDGEFSLSFLGSRKKVYENRRQVLANLSGGTGDLKIITGPDAEADIAAHISAKRLVQDTPKLIVRGAEHTSTTKSSHLGLFNASLNPTKGPLGLRAGVGNYGNTQKRGRQHTKSTVFVEEIYAKQEASIVLANSSLSAEKASVDPAAYTTDSTTGQKKPATLTIFSQESANTHQKTGVSAGLFSASPFQIDGPGVTAWSEEHHCVSGASSVSIASHDKNVVIKPVQKPLEFSDSAQASIGLFSVGIDSTYALFSLEDHMKKDIKSVFSNEYDPLISYQYENFGSKRSLGHATLAELVADPFIQRDATELADATYSSHAKICTLFEGRSRWNIEKKDIFGVEHAKGFLATYSDDSLGDTRFVAFVGTVDNVHEWIGYSLKSKNYFRPLHEIDPSVIFELEGGINNNFCENYLHTGFNNVVLNKDLPHVFTGHSRGAAVADIALLRTGAQWNDFSNIGSVTLAQPAVFSANLEEALNKKMPSQRYKIGHQEDRIFGFFYGAKAPYLDGKSLQYGWGGRSIKLPYVPHPSFSKAGSLEEMLVGSISPPHLLKNYLHSMNRILNKAN